MNYTFSMFDREDGRSVEISQSGVEYAGDLAEVMLNFVQACGYTYVDSLTFSSKDGQEWTTG